MAAVQGRSGAEMVPVSSRRTRSYQLARAGEFPCRLIRVGKTYQVPTAGLLTLLGIPQPACTRHHDKEHHGGSGTTFKRCYCRDSSGKDLGRDCPKLRRANGAWSNRHGTWFYQMELPPKADGKRRNPLRRGGLRHPG